MYNKNFLLAVIFAFCSAGAFFSIYSVFGDTHNWNTLLGIIGGLFAVGAIAEFAYIFYKQK